jgi:hypothetical protein
MTALIGIGKLRASGVAGAVDVEGAGAQAASTAELTAAPTRIRFSVMFRSIACGRYTQALRCKFASLETYALIWIKGGGGNA